MSSRYGAGSPGSPRPGSAMSRPGSEVQAVAVAAVAEVVAEVVAAAVGDGGGRQLKVETASAGSQPALRRAPPPGWDGAGIWRQLERRRAGEPSPSAR